MKRLLAVKLTAFIFVLAFCSILFSYPLKASAAPPDLPPGLQKAAEVQEAHTSELMKNPDVVGTAVSKDKNGKPVIKVYVTSQGTSGIPATLDGFRVIKQVTGELVAYKGPPPGHGGGNNGGGSTTLEDPQAIQSEPIKLGTSGGWKYDLANGYCCGGTLGALVEKGGKQYVLSNWHVLYSDIVSGGNGITAQSGDPVIQPGLIDVSCNEGNGQNVATLVANGGSLPDANVDAGIAEVVPDAVDPSGAILNIGTISSSTVHQAYVGQKVKKMGRTTGLSSASVDGLNATVSITYENECAGGTAFTKTYTGQIVATNNKCKFLDAGDSGSLMVEDVNTNPRAVGLLYAGSSICNPFAIAIANPIDDVLNYFGATMVGN